VDSTVQEKNITFPPDTKLNKRIIEKVNKIAQKEGIKLRQSYTRTTKQLMIEQRFRNHPKRKKKANAAAKKIKTIAGRMIRDLERKLAHGKQIIYKQELELFSKVIQLKQTDKNKIYSLHELAIDCIAKGKEARKYEFGNKSGFVLGKKSGIVIGVIAFENNPFDGHTLNEHLFQTEELPGKRPKVTIVDRGYRGKTKIGSTEIISPKPLGKKAVAYQKRKPDSDLEPGQELNLSLGILNMFTEC